MSATRRIALYWSPGRSLAGALEATQRMHRALEAYAAILVPEAVDEAALVARLRGRVEVSLRWLYGRKSETILPPKL